MPQPLPPHTTDVVMKRQRSEIADPSATEHTANANSEDALQVQIIAAVKEKKYKEAMTLIAEACLVQGRHASDHSQDECKGKTDDMPVDDSDNEQQDNSDENDGTITKNAIETSEMDEKAVYTFDQVAASLQTSLKAIINATSHIMDTRSRYLEGRKTDANASLKLAIREARQVIGHATLCNQLREVKTTWKLAPILKLNDDVLLEIFSYFGTKDMLSCSQVNQQWQLLLMKPLQGQTLQLKGTVEKIDEEWKRFGRAMQKAGITKLDVCFEGNGFDDYIGHYHGQDTDFANEIREREHNTGVGYRFLNSSLYKHFPAKTLESIIFSSDNLALDKPFWKCITKCERLKSIDWDFSYAYEGAVYEEEIDLSDFKVAGTPLAKCRLEKISIVASTKFEIEKEFKDLCKDATSCRVLMEVDEEVNFD